MHVDTQAMVDELVQEGVKPQLAKVQVHQIFTALNSHLATKEDIADVRTDLARSDKEIQAEIKNIGLKVTTQISTFETKFSDQLAEIRSDIRMIKYVGTLAIPVITALLIKVMEKLG